MAPDNAVTMAADNTVMMAADNTDNASNSHLAF